MSFKFRLATSLIVLTLVGCSGKTAANAASGGESAAGGSGPSVATSSGTRVEAIKDPTLNNMNAFDVTVPVKWHFQGTLYQGGNCTPVPDEVFRVTSPDGLSYVERMPALSWRWGTGPMAAHMPQSDCLPVNGPMSAEQFLKYVAGTLHVDYVSSDAVPAAENAKAQTALQNAQAAVAGKYAASGMQPPKSTRELARAMVSYKNGTFAMKGRLNVTIDCMETVYAGMKTLGPWGGPGHPPQMVTGASSTIEKCTGAVTYFTAPEAQFTAMLRQWDADGMGGRAEDAWQQAWIQRNTQQTNNAISAMNSAAAAARQASAQQFAQGQAVRQQMHEQFLAMMQRGTDMSMAQTQASMNARTTAASDWVDYALDQRTVADPNTGQLTKVSNQAATAWGNGAGQVYQSRDPNANPNGILPGNWTQQSIVHGNGVPQ
jgi:hypothetical protein